MGKFAKKIVSSVLALTLVMSMASTCLAADTWGSYFGADEGWYEGASGELTTNTNTAFTANINTVGWGGIWGAQVYREDISVKKGGLYTLSFSIKSSNVTKYVYVKISTGEDLAYSTWVKVPAGETVKVSETFTAKNDAKTVYFGMGGDAGDRDGVTTDEDAAIRYAVLGDDYHQLLQEDSNGDYTAATQISVTKFSIGLAKPDKVKIKKAKAGSKSIKLTYKKVKNANGYQIQYSLKKNMKPAKAKTTKKAKYTIKKLTSGKKYYVRVRAYIKNGKKIYGSWSKKKAVKVK